MGTNRLTKLALYDKTGLEENDIALNGTSSEHLPVLES